jgi:hypothetical protein
MLRNPYFAAADLVHHEMDSTKQLPAYPMQDCNDTPKRLSKSRRRGLKKVHCHSGKYDVSLAPCPVHGTCMREPTSSRSLNSSKHALEAFATVHDNSCHNSTDSTTQLGLDMAGKGHELGECQMHSTQTAQGISSIAADVYDHVGRSPYKPIAGMVSAIAQGASSRKECSLYSSPHCSTSAIIRERCITPTDVQSLEFGISSSAPRSPTFAERLSALASSQLLLLHGCKSSPAKYLAVGLPPELAAVDCTTQAALAACVDTILEDVNTRLEVCLRHFHAKCGRPTLLPDWPVARGPGSALYLV